MTVSLGFVCNPYHRGGITRWMVDFAVAWHLAGGESWLIAPRPRRPFKNGRGRPTVLDLLGAYPQANWPTVIDPAVGAEYELGTESYRATVYAAAIEAGIPRGVTLLPSDDPAAWRAIASVADRYPLIGVLHSDGDNYYALARRHAPAAAALVCVSNRIATRARSLLGAWSGPIEVIPCGAPIAPLRPRDMPSDAPLRLIWIGRMDEKQKRVSDLPKVAHALCDAGFSFTLDIVGSGPEEGRTRSAIARLGLDHVVRLHGWRAPADVKELLGASDVLIMPSNYEGMSVAVMEALAHGCAVVATRVSGVEDYEHHPLARDCLWVYPVGDIAAAVAAIGAAAQVAPAARARAARALAEAELSLEACTARYRQLLGHLAPAHTRRSCPIPSRAIAGIVSFPMAMQRAARLWMARHRDRHPRPELTR